MSENKGSTRGKPKIMPLEGGGAVRAICEDRIEEAFQAAFGKCASSELKAEIAHRLRIRIVDVDNPPASATKRQVEAVANSAKRLQKNLDAMPGSRELLEEIAWINPSIRMDTNNFFRFLTHLQSTSHFTDRKSPATVYRSTIKAIAIACANDGARISKTESGAFLRFLICLEDTWPGLIFPNGTTPQARRDYLRASLAV